VTEIGASNEVRRDKLVTADDVTYVGHGDEYGVVKG